MSVDVTAGFLLTSALGIAYQDFKDRLISLWLLVVFTFFNITFFLQRDNVVQFLFNVLFCAMYVLLCYCAITGYYFIKTGSVKKIMNSAVGWADAWIILAIGSCLSPQDLLVFFALSFCCALIIHIFLFRSSKTVPLAGYISLAYLPLVISRTLGFFGFVPDFPLAI